MNVVLRQAKVQKSYRNDLNGNEGRKLLKYIADKLDQRHQFLPYQSVFTALSALQSYATATRLTEGQIDELSFAITDFSRKFRTYPNDELSRIDKLHHLENHVMEWVHEHKSWGFFSTQGLYFNCASHVLRSKLQDSKASTGSEIEQSTLIAAVMPPTRCSILYEDTIFPPFTRG